MRFDWYQCTIEEDPVEVFSRVGSLGHELRPADSLAKRYHYQKGYQVYHHRRGVVATVLAGGNGDGNHAHAFASSDNTEAFVDLVRSAWPDRHLVTRLDAAQDFNDRQAYPRIRKLARKVAKRHRLAFPTISDDLNPKAGRTQYIGSPKSDYRGRLYEKGLEQLSKLRDQWARMYPNTELDHDQVLSFRTPEGVDVHPLDWIRLEAQIRPHDEQARRIAAQASPTEAWGFTSWTQELAREALALELERIYIRQRKVSEDEAALRWMCQQYGQMLTRLKHDLGDWACVGLEIGQIVQEYHQQRRGNGGGSAP